MAQAVVNTIKCNKEGNSLSSDRRKILAAMQYCDSHSKYECTDIRDALKEYEMENALVIGSQDIRAAGMGELAFTYWSCWKIGNKKYTILTK